MYFLVYFGNIFYTFYKLLSSIIILEMSKLFFGAVSIVLLAIARGDDDLPLWRKEFEPTTHLSEVVSRNNNETVYRLPHSVIPLEYEIYIDLYFAEITDRPFSYDGREFITIQVSIILESI